LYACIVYLSSAKSLAAVVGMIGVFIAWYMGVRAEGMELPALLTWIKGQGGNASHAAIVLSGTALSLLIMGRDPKTEYPRLLRQILALAALLAVAGYFLEPFYGIHKNAATPTWGLYSAAICTAIFAFLYWLMDVKGIVAWAGFLRPAGANALLIYFLPPIFYAGLAWSGLGFYSALGFGMVGIIRSIVFSLIMLWAVAWLNKRGISLKI
jgi:predicted acyltransferase